MDMFSLMISWGCWFCGSEGSWVGSLAEISSKDSLQMQFVLVYCLGRSVRNVIDGQKI